MTKWKSAIVDADRNKDWKDRLKRSIRDVKWSESLQIIVDKILADEPLNVTDGCILFECKNLNELGHLANLHKIAMFITRILIPMFISTKQIFAYSLVDSAHLEEGLRLQMLTLCLLMIISQN